MNELNESGNKIGYWEWYHNNGEIRSKGNYSDDGKKIGYWEDFYYRNGEISSKGNYTDGERIGYWEYFSNGNLWYKEYYI